MAKIEIQTPRLLSEIDEQLIKHFYEVLGRRTASIYVKKLERLGKKAIKLLLVYFDKGKKTLPYVVKINTKKEIEREYKAIRFVQNYIRDAEKIEQSPCYDGYGALLYPHQGNKELEDVVYDEKECSLNELCRCFTTIYGFLCLTAHEASKPKSIELLKHYGWYLRDRAAEERIQFILGSDAKKRQFRFLETTIYNPLVALERLQGRITCNVGPVHGDLHPKNVILDASKQPHLIDFAWSRYQRHVLVDFVLLENSLRFVSFPKDINPREQLQIDKWLLREEGYSKISNCSFSTGKKKGDYLRLAYMTQKIRESARRVAGKDYDFSEYLLSQFVVLYGLLKHDEYAIPSTVRALGLIANNLFRKGLIK